MAVTERSNRGAEGGLEMTVPRSRGKHFCAAGVGLGLLLCAGSAVVAAQQQVQAPVFRSSVDAVRLDVTVLDAAGNPVTGLTAADFTILERGVPRPVVGVSEVSVPPPPTGGASWLTDITADVETNAVEARRLVVIVVDDAANLGIGQLRRARRIGHRIVDELGPSDLAAVVFTRDNRRAQGFTADRVRLRAAIDRTPGSHARTGIPSPELNCLYPRYTLHALTRLAESLEAVPDRRKIVAFISPGVLVEWGSSNERCSLASRARRLFDAAQRAHLSIYAYATSGSSEALVSGNGREFLVTLAERTGGRQTLSGTNIDRGVATMFRDNAHYYLVGYEPSSLTNYHKIEVVVDRPDVVVRAREMAFPARRGALASFATGDDEDDRDAPLLNAMAGLLPQRDLPMAAVASVIAAHDRRSTAANVAVVTAIDLAAMAVRPDTAIDIDVQAFNPDGRRLAGVTHTLAAAARAADGLLEVVSPLQLAPGQYEVRVSAVDRDTSVAGSVYTFVDVVDVTRAPVTLSDLLLVMPVPATAAQVAAAGRPTARRTFAATDVVQASVRVYRRSDRTATPLTLELRLTDASGRETVAVTRPVEWPAGAAGPPYLDVTVDVPTATLAPGPHLVTLTATGASAPVVRRVRIDITD